MNKNLFNSVVDCLKGANQSLVTLNAIKTPVRNLVPKSDQDRIMQDLISVLKKMRVIECAMGFTSMAERPPFFYATSFRLTDDFYHNYKNKTFRLTKNRPTMNNTMQVENIDINQIEISSTNPRSRFREDALRELAESIGENGLINPITIRPLHKSGMFELVAGERRYRATKMAGLTKIDANIRELTDDQAFDIQVVENLQREEVHPLDEAEGFQKMLDSGRYDIDEIARRVGKSESFIRQRLQMNDMIEPLKGVFHEEDLKIGHAMELSRLQEDTQQDLYNTFFSDSEAYNYMPTVKELKNCIEREYLLQLDSAVFDTKDPQLFPEAGPCTTCPKRTGNNPILFPDLQEEDQCTDRPCYEMKQRLHMMNLIEKYKDDPDFYFIKSHGSIPDYLQEKIDDENINVLDWWDDYSEDSDSELKGIRVDGMSLGEIKSIRLKENDSMTKAERKEELSPSEYARTEIDRIEGLRERKVELDREKIFKKIIPVMEENEEFQKAEKTTGKFRTLAALWIVYNDINYIKINHLRAQWGIGNTDISEDAFDYGRTSMSHIEIFQWMEGLTAKELDQKLNEAISYWVLSHCTSESTADYGKWIEPYLMKTFAETYIPEDAKDFEAIQAEKAEAREERYTQRIANHQATIAEANDEEE